MKAVSLFSGCGGLDLGLERAGFEVVFASDIDSYCAASYELNFPDVPFYEGTAGDLTKDLLAKVSKGATLGPVDLLAGGPLAHRSRSRASIAPRSHAHLMMRLERRRSPPT
jgi:DNA (cytosine-5)-methyltransferase 1